MYASILIAVDDTEIGRHALEQALILARSEESRVTLVSVVPAYEGDLRLLGDTKALAAMREPYERALHEAGELARAMDVEYAASLLEGDPVEEILSLSEERRVDLLCVGKQGSYYSDMIPIGSVAAKLARLAECDVLITPARRTLRLDSILVPVDGSAPSARAAERAIRLCVRYGAALTLATVYEMSPERYALAPDSLDRLHQDAAEMQEPIKVRAREKGVRDVEGIVRMGTPVYKVLVDVACERNIGLVVMGNAGRGGFQRLLLGSVAERVIGSGEAPVLLARKEMNHAD